MNEKYEVIALQVNESRCVVQIVTPKGIIYHSIDKLPNTVGRLEARKLQELLDDGGKVPNKQQWTERPRFRRTAGHGWYDKGYAVCRACDKILLGNDFCFGGDAWVPTGTREKALKNEFGGFVCNDECDHEATVSMKGSMPGAGRFSG